VPLIELNIFPEVTQFVNSLSLAVLFITDPFQVII